MNPRSRLLTAVVVSCVLAAGLGFFLVMQKSPEAARVRLLVDVLLLAALAATAFVVTRNPLERREELLDAMRALARGARDRRLDYEHFGDLEDIARTYNEVAAALTEHEDPNLGPIKTKRRQERPAWMEPEGGSHADLGEVRVISKKQKAAQAMEAEERAAKAKAMAEEPEPVLEHKAQTQAKAKKRAKQLEQEPAAVAANDDDLPERPASAAPRRAGAEGAEEPTPEEELARVSADTQRPAQAVLVDDDRTEEASGRLASAASNNDTAIDELLRASKDSEPDAPAVQSEPSEAEALAEGEPQGANDDEAKALPPFDMRALFREFVDAKRAHDEATDDLEFEAFAETLEDEMARLLASHACRAVRFEVRVQDGEVSLLPRLIR